jgi:ankyrin repeat protein
MTALMTAANYGGSHEAMRLLLDRGADVNAASKLDITPLLAATASGGEIERIRVLLRSGARASGEAMFMAVELDRVDVVELLLDRGVPAELRQPEFDISMLAIAVVLGRVEMARLLLARGASVAATDVEGTTPLHWAAIVDPGHTRALELLLTAGADAQARTKAGLTPLDLARKHANTAAARVLEGKGGHE